jgi:O-antigen/teichoic acid export membrane protein
MIGKEYILGAVFRIGTMFSNVVLAVAVTNIYSQDQSGKFFFLQSLGTMLAVLAGGGMGNYLVKVVAGGKENKENLSVLIISSLILGLLFFLTYSTLFLVVNWLFDLGIIEKYSLSALIAFMASGLMICWYTLLAQVLQGRFEVSKCILVGNTILPCIFCFLLVISRPAFDWVACLYFLCGLAALIVGGFLVNVTSFFRQLNIKLLPKGIFDVISASKNFVLFVYITFLAQLGNVLVIGFIGTASEVSAVSVCSKIATLSNFAFLLMNTMMMPRLAQAYAQNNLSEFQRWMKVFVGVVLVNSIVFLFVAVFFGETLLGTFGSEYEHNKPSLILLMAVQMIAVTLNCFSTAAMMSGGESELSKVNVIFSLVGFGSIFLLYNIFGVEGAIFSIGLTLLLIHCSSPFILSKRLALIKDQQ